MIKLIVAIKRRENMAPQDFQAYWKASHGTKVRASACGQKYIRRYVQCHTLLADYANGAEPAFDGTAELWFDSVADKEAFYADPEYLATIAPDELEFADMTRTVFFQTEEYDVM